MLVMKGVMLILNNQIQQGRHLACMLYMNFAIPHPRFTQTVAIRLVYLWGACSPMIYVNVYYGFELTVLDSDAA